MLKTLERDRWLSIALLAGLGGLLLVVVRDFGLGLPPFPNGDNGNKTELIIPEASHWAELFSANAIPLLIVEDRRLSLFYTAYFQPPPQPKPPTTRVIPMIYQGFFATSKGNKEAFVTVDQKPMNGPVGTQLAADLVIAEINMRSLILTNASGETNLLEFRKTTKVQVPVK